MNRYVAFLRGINLGNRRLKMDELRRHVRVLDVANPCTYLASGNVIFDHGGSQPVVVDLEASIEVDLREALGYEVATLVRRLDALSEIVVAVDGELAETGAGEEDRRSKEETPRVKRHVVFLRPEADSKVVTALRSLETPDDRFHVVGGEVVWMGQGRLSNSSIRQRHLEKAFAGRSNSMRTLKTVRRIVAKFGK